MRTVAGREAADPFPARPATVPPNESIARYASRSTSCTSKTGAFSSASRFSMNRCVLGRSGGDVTTTQRRLGSARKSSAARTVSFQMTEVRISKKLFAEILRMIVKAASADRVNLAEDRMRSTQTNGRRAP